MKKGEKGIYLAIKSATGLNYLTIRRYLKQPDENSQKSRTIHKAKELFYLYRETLGAAKATTQMVEEGLVMGNEARKRGKISLLYGDATEIAKRLNLSVQQVCQVADRMGKGLWPKKFNLIKCGDVVHDVSTYRNRGNFEPIEKLLDEIMSHETATQNQE